jgi:hypothetical protein
MERLAAIYSPAPAANDREAQVSSQRAPSPAKTKPGRSAAAEVQPAHRPDEEVAIRTAKTRFPSTPLVSGVGEIQIHNYTSEAVLVRLATTRVAALRAINLASGADATLAGVDPDIYWVNVIFPQSARVPILLGPLMFVQTETDREFTADSYDITLKPLAASGRRDSALRN